jgi:hypothetical protein
MAGIDDLLVKQGDDYSAEKWDRLVQLNRGNRLYPGRNIRFRVVPGLGTVVNADIPPADFSHPFQCGLNGSEVQIALGFINTTIIPTIKDVPIGGDESTGVQAPVFTVTSEKFANGRSYICAEVTCDTDWKAKSAVIVQVPDIASDGAKAPAVKSVQVAQYPSLSNRRTRYPIALLRRNSAGVTRLYQIAYFNVQHLAKSAGAIPTSDTARHFFFV